MKATEIITAFVALYGAALSTIVFLRQLFSEKVKVKLTVNRHMKILNDPLHHGHILTILKVVNAGRRPVTITTVGAFALYPHDSFVAGDVHPRLPCEITEGKYISSYMNESEIDFETIDYWEALDSHGRVHKLRVASRFKHWKSRFQLKRSPEIPRG